MGALRERKSIKGMMVRNVGHLSRPEQVSASSGGGVSSDQGRTLVGMHPVRGTTTAECSRELRECGVKAPIPKRVLSSPWVRLGLRLGGTNMAAGGGQVEPERLSILTLALVRGDRAFCSLPDLQAPATWMGSSI